MRCHRNRRATKKPPEIGPPVGAGAFAPALRCSSVTGYQPAPSSRLERRQNPPASMVSGTFQALYMLMTEVLRRSLDDLKKADLHRSLRVLDSAPSARVSLEGREVVNFASNNYLGLAG